MNIAIISENHQQLLMHFDMLYKQGPPDVYDSLDQFEAMGVTYDVVIVDHQVHGRKWHEIYKEGVKFVVLATNPMHYYKLEFPDTLYKDLEMIFDLRGCHFIEKTDLEGLKVTIDLFFAFNLLRNHIKKHKL